MAIKIDLEKEYDRVSWAFFKETPLAFGFSQKWVNLIMLCVESSNMSILWNGEKLDSFISERGLRQGDPLSPYLFLLCMERLGHLINQKVESGAWKPIRVGKDGPGISHIFFADDLFLFSRAGTSQIDVIKKVLHTFCLASGAKISFEKSRFFMSPKARGRKHVISSALGISYTGNLGKYLEVPLIHGRITKDTFKEIIDKISGRL